MRIKSSLPNLLSYLYFIAGVWGLVSTDNTNTMFYIVTVGYLAVEVCFLAISHRRLILFHDKVSRIPIMMITVWIFGFLAGLLNQNNPAYVVRNFSGITLYFLFYVFTGTGLNIRAVEKIVTVLAAAVVILTLVVYVMLQAGIVNVALEIPFVKCFILNGDGTGYIAVWYSAIGLLPFCYVCSLYRCFHSGKVTVGDLFVIIGSLAVMLICSSTGGVQAMILGMTVILYFSESGIRVKKVFVLAGVTAAVALVILFIIKGINPLEVIFGAYDGGNQVRYKQISYIFSHLKLFGHGLGAEYTAIGKGYGIEVIYLDIIYKFGIVSIPIFYSYIYTFLKSVKLMKEGDGDYRNAIPFALMGYAFIALGNPVLFSATSVLCHVTALMIMEERIYLTGEIARHCKIAES